MRANFKQVSAGPGGRQRRATIIIGLLAETELARKHVDTTRSHTNTHEGPLEACLALAPYGGCPGTYNTSSVFYSIQQAGLIFEVYAPCM